MKHTDINGFWEIEDNPISCAGVYPYLGAHLPGAADPARIYMVLRPPEELGRPETIESFRLQPWTIGHEMLGPEEDGLTPPEEKGVHGVIGEKVWFDETADPPTLFANIKGFSEALKRAIANGVKQLSAGYFHDVEWKGGVWNGQPFDAIQRNISANHLASVPSGRMGPGVAVMDSLRGYDPNPFTVKHFNQMEETMDETMDEKPAPEEAETCNVQEAAPGSEDNRFEEEASVMPELSLETLAEAVKAVAERLNRLESGSETAPEASGKDEEGEHEKDAPDMADKDALKKEILRDMADRDALATQLVPHVGTFDHSLMTEQEVAAYGCRKLGVSCTRGHESTALRAYLKGARAAMGPVFSASSPSFSMDNGIGSGAPGKSRKLNDYLMEEI